MFLIDQLGTRSGTEHAYPFSDGETKKKKEKKRKKKSVIEPRASVFHNGLRCRDGLCIDGL